MQTTAPAPLVLASTSPYRKELLARTGLTFVTAKPELDESELKAQIKDPKRLASELAIAKARSLGDCGGWVIGSDQVVALDQTIFGKPHTAERAKAQLAQLQGQTHHIITAVAVHSSRETWTWVDFTEMHLRSLNEAQIARYVQADQPLDCAGAYKIECRGLTLFHKIVSEDFSAIQGLPMIRLTNYLIEQGFVIP